MKRFFGKAPASADDALPRARPDPIPLLLLPLMALFGFGLAGNFTEWVNLTIAGIGMGMILFMASSGLTLVFGLMKVMNFAHAIFFTLGAFVGGLVVFPNVFLLPYAGFWVDNVVVNVLSLLLSGLLGMVEYWYFADSLWLNLCGLAAAMVLVLLVCIPLGLLFERWVIRPAGKVTLTQIMMTVAGMVVISELMIALFGQGMRVHAMPGFKSSLVFGDIAIEKLRVLMIVLGLVCWAGLSLLLQRTRLGLLVRATVENREQVEALGYQTRRLMLGMFALGVGLGALSGLVWGVYQQAMNIRFGNTLLPMLFLVLMIGGTGSLTGTLIAALLLALLNNYVGFAWPMFTAFAGIALALAVITWRPQGLYPAQSS